MSTTPASNDNAPCLGDDAAACIACPSKCPVHATSGWPAMNIATLTNQCAAAALVCELVQTAILNERARAAAREVADYSFCFGPNAPVGAKARYHRIIRVASTRMAIALLNLPSF